MFGEREQMGADDGRNIKYSALPSLFSYIGLVRGATLLPALHWSMVQGGRTRRTVLRTIGAGTTAIGVGAGVGAAAEGDARSA